MQNRCKMMALYGLAAAFGGILSALSTPLIVLNILGGIVSGIWLAIIGEWAAIFIGLLLTFVSAVVLGFALMPVLLLLAPAVHYSKKGNSLVSFFFRTLSNIYVLVLVSIWCFYVMSLFVRGATEDSLIPRLIWSYGVALGPWIHMARKEQGDSFEGFASLIVTFFAEIAYVVSIFLFILTPKDLSEIFKVFGAFMAVCLIVQLLNMFIIFREEKHSTIIE